MQSFWNKKTRCDKKDVPSTIKKVIASYGKRKIKFIYGGGKSLEGIIAYYEAIFELKKQMERIDHLFVSCGTGTTLTGICAGMQEVYPESHVHAISVARTFNEEEKILLEDMKILNNFLDKNYTFNNMTFYEQFLCGGYDEVTPDLLECIKECIAREGMIVDPCYSGKSLYGMCEIINRNPNYYKGKNILYWNTGGLLNLLSKKELF